jgi:hypothetical protein
LSLINHAICVSFSHNALAMLNSLLAHHFGLLGRLCQLRLVIVSENNLLHLSDCLIFFDLASCHFLLIYLLLLFPYIEFLLFGSYLLLLGSLLFLR